MNWKEIIKKSWSKFRQIFEDSKGDLSSKRVFGAIGFISAIVMAFKGIPTDTIIAVLSPSALMIGLDSVTDIWKYKEQPLQTLPKIEEHEIDK
jgi:hypothetical protein